MEISLRNKILTVVGLNNSGKSYLVKNFILPKYKCIVYDPLHEYNSSHCDVFYPTKNTYPDTAIENEGFINNLIIKGKYELLIYDEATRVFPNQKPLLPLMRSFFDTYRHYNQLGLVFICRRPVQLQTDIPSLSHHIISFGTKGLPDINRLNAESAGLGDACSHLDQYHFCFVNENRTYFEHDPI